MQTALTSRFWRRFIPRTPAAIDSWRRMAQKVRPPTPLFLVVFLSLGLHSGKIYAADEVWRLIRPPSGPSAETPTLKPCMQYFQSVKVGIRSISVRRTPDDPGDTEEWDISLRSRDTVQKRGWGEGTEFGENSFRLEVKDQLRTTKVYKIEKYVVFPGVARWGALEIEGKESDQWPNPDDRLPWLPRRILFDDGSRNEHGDQGLCGSRLVDVDDLLKNAFIMDECKKTKDGAREACYEFYVLFIPRAVPGI